MLVKISPVKILSDLGYELVELETPEDYLSALMEAIVSLQGSGGSGRARADILQEELIRVRKARKEAAPSAGMKATKKTISPSKFFDKKEQKSLPMGKGEMGGAIVKVAEGVDSIVETLKEDKKQDKKHFSFLRKMSERFKRRRDENKLEFQIFDGLKKTATAALEPVKSAWSKLLDFLQNVILGRVLFKILEWMGNKDNKSKLESIIKFFKDWWPTLLAAYLLFGNSFGRMAVRLGVMVGKFAIKLVTKLIPKMLAGLAKLKAGALLKGGIVLGGAALITGAVLGAKALDGDFDQDKERTDEEKEADKEKADSAMDMGTLSMNKGGTVPGSGNTDTVPAMLTPGEFVMSKGAVQKYGSDTLAGMNAAAGGTNKPTLMGGYKEGGKAADRSHFGTEGYRMGQVLPDQFMYNKETFTSSLKTKGGEVIEDKETLTELGGSIGMPDLIENQTQLVESIRKVKGYEDINFMDVVQYPDGGGRLVDMPEETLFPILNSSDAWKASDARRDEAIRIDMESGTQFIDTGLKGGGLVQAFQGGGQVKRVQMGRGAAKRRMEASKITPIKKKKVTVAYAEEKDNMADRPTNKKSEQEIPSFNVTAMRSAQKIKVLGISV